ncbi:MAG: hypothetical protein E7387_01110 [Ruminococcaceae bacterium]|nr:hypothetical protein [Oscillospiraceae bacterium]
MNTNQKNGGNNNLAVTTKDKVFLLSVEEVEQYFNTQIARQFDSYNWWLRTPGNPKNTVAYVDDRGNINEDGRNVKVLTAVRPAMWIDLNS